MRKPRPSTNQHVPVSMNGAGLTSTGPCPQFIVTSARISAVTSATAGFARRIASWTLSAAAARGSASHPVASRSPATTALMPSPTYHGRTAGTMARRFQLLALPAESLLIVLGRLGELALLSERQAQVGVGFGVVGLGAQRLLEMVDRLGRPALTIEQLSEVAVSDGRVGVDREGVGPEPPRVVPDLDLVPGEDSQRDDDTRGHAGKPPRRRCPCRRARGASPA